MNNKESLATIDDLKDSFLGNVAFPESKSVQLSKQLITASAFIRNKFKNADKDIDVEISSGRLDEVLVRDIVVRMVKRAYLSSINGAAQVDASNYSQSAGPYSFSYSPGNASGDYYLKKEELKTLGLSRGYARNHRMW